MFTLVIEDKYGAIVDEYSFEDGEFVIGRSQSCDIVLAADNVSRRHARLYTAEGRCFIEDLNAANGIWLNGKRIFRVTELPRSAQVRIGDFYLHIEGASFSRMLQASTFAQLIPSQGGGEPFELNRPTTLVGRGRDCSFVINDPSVSRIHAKLTQDEEGRIVVEDLRSSNGVYVNDQRVDLQTVNTGDRVRFGTVGFVLQRDGEELYDDWQPPPRRVSHSRPAYTPQPYGGGSYAPAASLHGEPSTSILPQVAAIAVIVLAFVCLIVVVGFAFDRWVSPMIVAKEQARQSVQSGAVEKGATDKKDQKERASKQEGEEAFAQAKDAMRARQWSKAQAELRKARDLDYDASAVRAMLSQVEDERRASDRFERARKAVTQKSYEDAITDYKNIPQKSVYRDEADKKLAALVKLLVAGAESACEANDTKTCKEHYRLALMTDVASEEVKSAYRKLLEGARNVERRQKRRRRRRR